MKSENSSFSVKFSKEIINAKLHNYRVEQFLIKMKEEQKKLKIALWRDIQPLEI